VLTDLTTPRHPAAGAPSSSPPVRVVRTHTDSPDTSHLFLRLVELPHGPTRDSVREELVRAWLPMAHRIAGRFHDRGEAMEDLRQVAALGLVKAVDRFDPTRGAFESYAVPTITGELKRHFRDRVWAVHVPRRVQDLRNQVRLARRDLTHTPGSPEPALADIAAHTGLTVDEVATGMEALESFSALSLDAAIATDEDGDGHSLADVLGGPDASYQLVIDREAAKEQLRRLPERERAILYLRFFEDLAQHRIADRFGLSQMHISRLITRSCARVREGALRETCGDPTPAW
jgi:RNA polymerase sigma-B factor